MNLKVMTTEDLIKKINDEVDSLEEMFSTYSKIVRVGDLKYITERGNDLKEKMKSLSSYYEEFKSRDDKEKKRAVRRTRTDLETLETEVPNILAMTEEGIRIVTEQVLPAMKTEGE